MGTNIKGRFLQIMGNLPFELTMLATPRLTLCKLNNKSKDHYREMTWLPFKKSIIKLPNYNAHFKTSQYLFCSSVIPLQQILGANVDMVVAKQILQQIQW